MVALSETDKSRVRYHLSYSDAADDGDRALLEDRMINIRDALTQTRITAILNQLDVQEIFLQGDLAGGNGDYVNVLLSRRLITGDVNRTDIEYRPEDPKTREKKYVTMTNFLAVKLGVVNYHNLDWAMNSMFRLGVRIPRTIIEGGGSGGGVAGVSSFNGRTGAVVPLTGDYTAFNVGALAIANNLSEVPSPTIARANLGVAIGSQVQAFSTLLSQIVSGFAGATDNQVLSKQGSNLAYVTSSGGGGGGGEANTGANVGTTGVGIFRDKTGVTLNFKQLSSSTPRIVIGDDVANSRITLDLNGLTPGTDIQPYAQILAQAVSGFAAATDNQVLTKSGSNLIYATPAAGGGAGEANTGANVGTNGIGLFKNKTGVTLNFKKLQVNSSRLTIVDDTGTDRVLLDIGTLTTADIPNLSGTYQPLNARLTEVGSSFAAALSGQVLTKSGSNLVYATPSTSNYVIVRTVFVGAMNLSAPGSTFDGVAMNNGDRFLLVDTSTASNSGTYTFNGAASTATRTADNLIPNLLIGVSEGTDYNDTIWMLTTNAPIVVNTTGLTFLLITPIAQVGDLHLVQAPASTPFIDRYDGKWVFLTNNAYRTIGNTGSGADIVQTWLQKLYEFWWNNYDNTTCQVLTSGGSGTTRGASATADWTALKRITMPDIRGRNILPAGQGAGSLTNRVKAAIGGAETHTLTTPEMPSHTHGDGASGFIRNGGSGVSTGTGATVWSTSGVTTSTGGGGAHNNMQPFFVENYLVAAGVR